jgi:hypothetical protein
MVKLKKITTYFHRNIGEENCSESHKSEVYDRTKPRQLNAEIYPEQQKLFLKIQCRFLHTGTLATYLHQLEASNISTRVKLCLLGLR